MQTSDNENVIFFFLKKILQIILSDFARFYEKKDEKKK